MSIDNTNTLILTGCEETLKVTAPYRNKIPPPSLFVKALLLIRVCILSLPSVITQSTGQRTFSYAIPFVWNSYPCKVRSSKTHIFKIIFEISPLQAILLTL